MNVITPQLPSFLFTDEVVKNLAAQLTGRFSAVSPDISPQSLLNEKSIKTIIDAFIKSVFLKLEGPDTAALPLLDESIKILSMLADTKNQKSPAVFEKKLDSLLRNMLRLLFDASTIKTLPKPLAIYAQNEMLKNSEISGGLIKVLYDIDEASQEGKRQKSQELFALAEQTMEKNSQEKHSQDENRELHAKNYHVILMQMKEKLKKVLNTLQEYKKNGGGKLLTSLDERIDYLTKMLEEVERLLRVR